MERIEGLKEYVKSTAYREALDLPKKQEEEYTMLAQGEYNMNYSFIHPKTGKNVTVARQLWKPDASEKSDRV